MADNAPREHVKSKKQQKKDDRTALIIERYRVSCNTYSGIIADLTGELQASQAKVERLTEERDAAQASVEKLVGSLTATVFCTHTAWAEREMREGQRTGRDILLPEEGQEEAPERVK